MNAILVHDLPWIAFIFYFRNVQEAKNVSLLLFTFNILSLKIVLEKFRKLNNKFGFLRLFYKMQVLQICKHSLHVNICLSWWAVVSCMCFVSDLQENEEKFTLFGLIFPQGKNNIYSISYIKPCICIMLYKTLYLYYQWRFATSWLPKIHKSRYNISMPAGKCNILPFMVRNYTWMQMVDIWWIMERYWVCFISQ